MAEHTVSGRQRIPMSHSKVLGKKAQRNIAVLHEDRLRGTRVARERTRLVNKRVAKLKELHVPRDGIIRAVSNRAAKSPKGDPRIMNFKKMLRTYCELFLGYRSRHVVQNYLYLRLNQMLEEKKQKARELAVDAIREDVTRPDVCNAQLTIILRPLERSDVERLAELAIYEIREEILTHAATGKIVDCESGATAGYEPRMAKIGGAPGRTGFVIVDRTRGRLKVVALATEADFRRKSSRNWLTRRSRGYWNHPPRPERHPDPQ